MSDIEPQAVEDLLDAAFGTDRFGRTAYRIRLGMDAVPGLSFAAVEDGALIGTIQCWPVAHHAVGGAATPLVMVGPVAVRPDVQRGGHGRALMAHMLDAAETQADSALMMIGDPEYYGRFWGFSAASTGGWTCPGPYEARRLLALSVDGAAIGGEGMLGPRITTPM